MITVHPANERDLTRAAHVLADAFADDPTYRLLFADAREHRAERMQRFFQATIKAVGCECVDLARHSHSGEIAGVAIWVPPRPTNALPVRVAHQLRAGLALGLRGVQAGVRYERAVAQVKPHQAAWHLSDIAAAPAARGLGVGSALLQHRLRLIDAQRLPAALEATTPASRRLYERFGFEFVAELPHEVGGGAVAMARPAATT